MRCFRSAISVILSVMLMLSFTACETKGENDVSSTPEVPTQSLTVYPLASCYTQSEVFSASVNGEALPVNAHNKMYDYARFSFTGEAKIEVTVPSEIKTFTVSPLAKEIEAKAEGKTLSFTITESLYMIVKINSYEELIIVADGSETDVPESEGEGIFNITSAPYNADPTGESLSNEALQKAIDDASRAKGTVYVPDGLYYISKSIVLKSDVDIYLSANAVIRSVADPSGYETFYHKNSLNMDGTWLFYTAENTENIRIYGRGIIDGNGYDMRMNHKYLATLVMPIGCSGFTLDGITLSDGNFWSLIPTRCDNVKILNTKHLNENNELHENDAIDIVESQNVSVKHTLAISEDDTYSTKTWSTYPTTDIAVNWYGEPEELNTVTFDDCFGWTHCGTFKVGDGNFQPQRNVTFKNSYSYKCMSALKLTHGYGTVPAENIVFENIDIEGFGGRWSNTQKWLDFYQNSDGPVNNVTVRNINVRTTGSSPSTLKGRNGTYFYDGVTLENIYINGSTTPARSLKEMNVTDTNGYVKNLVILPEGEETDVDKSNLALNKTVVASSTADSCPAPDAVDGFENTRWASARTDEQWIYVDLGEATEFDRVVLLWEAAYGKEYTVDVSNDAESWKTVHTETDGKGGEKVIDLEMQNARYVRMKGIKRGTQYGYSLYEFEVHNTQKEN